MKFNKSHIYLTRGKKKLCFECKTELEYKEKDIELKSRKPHDSKLIKERILFCPVCDRYYVNQDICCSLVKKYPGYYLDVSTYQLKIKKAKRTTSDDNKNISSIINNADTHNTVVSNENKLENEHHKYAKTAESRNSDGILYVPVYFSNVYALVNKICPQCNSVLSEEKVNVPVIRGNGDFHHYYVTTALYCHNCRRGYISNKNIVEIVDRMQKSITASCGLLLENMEIQYDAPSKKCFYYPTLDNEDAIYVSKHNDIEIVEQNRHIINFKSKSFLAEMGYTVNKREEARRFILKQAVQKYGKRKVTDHIFNLIRFRRRQNEGALRYASAIRIWQMDLNYVSSLDEL